LRSKLFGCVADDQYCVTCVRGLSLGEVLARLGLADQEEHPRYTSLEAARHFGYDVPILRIHDDADWTILLEVNPHFGKTLQPQTLARLSGGTEAVSAQKMLDSTAKAAHALDGELLATYIDWDFVPAKGADPSRLNRALTNAGFFQEENEDSDEWRPPEMVLLALEREFGISVSPHIANGPLPTVAIPHRKAQEAERKSLRRKPNSTPKHPRQQIDKAGGFE
jgi:uncharacterized protein DUF6461